jgi:hypothetical protein
MKSESTIEDLKLEFDKFVREKCILGEDDSSTKNQNAGDTQDEEAVPAFVDDIADKLMSPEYSGVYLSRIDIKRVAEAIDESIPVKERKKMIKALFRHTTTKEYLRVAFDEFNRHINGRVLIYQELSEAFPSSKYIFDGYIEKTDKVKRFCDSVVENFEEIDPTFEPMLT